MRSSISQSSYKGQFPPRAFNMARYCLAGGAAAHPDKPALIVVDNPNETDFSEIWTFAALEDGVLRMAGHLQEAGLVASDRLLIRLPNTSLFPLTFFGALAAGIVAMPVSSGLGARELEFLRKDSRAKAIAGPADDLNDAPPIILTQDTLAEAVSSSSRANWAATAADDPAYLIYTSGTTANPKGVLHAHRAAWGRRPMYDGWYGMREGDRILHAGAFNWTFTLGTGLTDPWANGATAIVYTGDKRPETWPILIQRTRATLFAAVPGVYRQILKYANPGPIDLAPLRHGLIAGEAPPANLFDDWKERTGTELFEALGMSEISTYLSSSPTSPRRPGSTGKPQPGRAVAILPIDEGSDPLPIGTDGLIAVHRSDPGLMLGYWERPLEEAEVYRGDWFVGGDLGRMDEDGYVTHLGRANDIMKALGYRVAPQEVEAALIDHPQIAEVACTELRVREDVTVIAAFIVVKDPANPPDAADILSFAEDRLAPYKRPREIRFVDALPRTPNGKIKRSDLAAASL